jgi:hypothetical protein
MRYIIALRTRSLGTQLRSKWLLLCATMTVGALTFLVPAPAEAAQSRALAIDKCTMANIGKPVFMTFYDNLTAFVDQYKYILLVVLVLIGVLLSIVGRGKDWFGRAMWALVLVLAAGAITASLGAGAKGPCF